MSGRPAVGRDLLQMFYSNRSLEALPQLSDIPRIRGPSFLPRTCTMPAQSRASLGPSPTASSEPRKKKHCRSRSGCLPCRRRRRKCDGHRPVCLECKTRGVECGWGLKVSFHPSRSLQLSSEHTAALVDLDKQREKAHSDGHEAGEHGVAPLVIIDDTGEIVRSFCKDDGESSSADESDGDAPEHPLQERDEGASTIVSDGVTSYGAFFRSDKEEVRNENTGPSSLNSDAVARCGQDKAFDPFNLIPPAPNLSPPAVTRTPLIPELWIADLPIAPFSLGQAISRGASPEPEPRFPVSQTMKIDLMSAYIKETATWCETTDSEMHFSARSVHHMMDSKPFVVAAMSLASRQLDAMQGCPRHITLELYQYTIRLLLGYDPAEADSSILATCTILCVYEMMASSVSEWRRHLRGCAGLLRMCKWNGNSEGIVKACFWAFARIDVWAAFILNQTTLIPTDSWVDEDSLVLVAAKGDTDDYCNLAILIFARIINVLNEEDGVGRSSQAELREKAQASWEELQRWRCWRRRSVKPLLRVDKSEKNAFPTIVFALSASICGNTFYHAGSILLLQSGLVRPDHSLDVAEVSSPVWHARELGGISTSNTSHANWVNHLQPLYIAGKVFGGTPKQTLLIQPGRRNYRIQLSQGSGQLRQTDPELAGSEGPSEPEDFAAEKIALLRHLAKIERETGWKTSERAKDLRMLWGLEN
ncbi:hypothetical protein EDB81DRAFT_828569 [Dactylonectria macrodidyma]|uniref:Zn(2)-C6 fungal-type domain-containing protein n=1 Tax=Dactylonectria macrodidyma TaxID=307937 RepID=A0A9P9I8R9_9HYPO|nr:hypothetical protein EDB81DRAFT_828569 [Dactylonectria macrodidyma]